VTNLLEVLLLLSLEFFVGTVGILALVVAACYVIQLPRVGFEWLLLRLLG